MDQSKIHFVNITYRKLYYYNEIMINLYIQSCNKNINNQNIFTK